jgi:hypothetical protein
MLVGEQGSRVVLGLKTADGQFREAELIRKTVDISRWSDQQP